MDQTTLDTHLLSHSVAPDDLAITVQKTKKRIQQAGDKPYITVEAQLHIVDELAQFELGQFLLQHRGLDGFWTHYILVHPWHGRKTGLNSAHRPFSDIEKAILDAAPTVLAHQQRFQHFLAENQKAVTNNNKLACIPCGTMGELLYLDYSGIQNIELVGIDLDFKALKEAQQLAEDRKLSHLTHFMQKNAWDLGLENVFDLISSTGLNVYEPDDKKVVALYKQLYLALKPAGKLVTSFMTYPPSIPEKCEWDISKVNLQTAQLQHIVFSDILESKFQCYRTSAETKKQLEEVGFKNIEFIWDEARVFPTVVAFK